MAVELGNAWREAQVAEREEVERILDELSALVAANAVALRETLGALARFDFWAAKASLAGRARRRSRAETADRPEVVLLGARHPGLTGRVVPIDIRLGDGYTALVVTGPNTGGKTVTLRTLGPARASCTRPASTSRPRPAAGCRSSATSSPTSATSSRSPSASPRSPATSARSSAIVEAAGPGTLVLLDELGAGTDPTEGSALAQALLDHFIRAGALVAATTHYAELKAYAHTTGGARNASVEFDLETLSPTYRLTIGLPGGSQAFAIAERLGLPIRRSSPTPGRGCRRTSARSRRRSPGSARPRARPARRSSGRGPPRPARRTPCGRADEERRRARRERDEAVRAARAEAERLVETTPRRGPGDARTRSSARR